MALMTRRLVLALAVAALAAGALAVTPYGTPKVAAAGCISIYRIYYDSPGDDTGSNTSRNGEWVQIKNRCSKAKSLSGWTLRDAAGHVYRFGTYKLAGASAVKVHTGKGTNTARNRYWGSSYYIWNNDGDTAKLKNGSGTLIDSCRYSGPGSSVYC
jgi:hypothetical protein